MVVHPAKGHWKGTLTSALAHHFQSLSDAGGPTRPGIVHRLDRETSGVIAIAKSNEVHFKLAALFEAREVSKEYKPSLSGALIAIAIGFGNRSAITHTNARRCRFDRDTNQAVMPKRFLK